MATKIDIESEPESEVTAEPEPTAVDESKPEPEIAAEPESKPTFVDEPGPDPEIEELLVETSADLPAELVIELVSSTLAVRVSVSLRLPDAYDPLQIFLKAIGSQEVEFLMVHSLVFSTDDLFRHAACVLFEIPSTAAGGSWKLVPPPPSWFSHDASVLIF